MDKTQLTNDFWGGFGAMLVALPSSIAFGVTIFSPLGAEYAAQGAIAGILGATALGLVAPIAGGTHRLITAPCAPAAAVLSAFAIQIAAGGIEPEVGLLRLALVGLMCGAMQVGFGIVGLGRSIKYMPYPVVSGYLTGVGIIIIVSQVPKFLLGASAELGMIDSLTSPGEWLWPGIVAGGMTVFVMLVAPRVIKAVPAAILGLAAGMLTYMALGLADDSLMRVTDNPLVVGQLSSSEGGVLTAIAAKWRGVGGLDTSLLVQVIVPAITLAVLLSIDTLKTCVVLDALTRSRHNSNREIVGQGIANMAATIVGGVNGAGTMGPTLVNHTSGGQTRISGVIEGVMALIAFLLLGSLIAWVPIASLAGILIVIGFRMIDWRSFSMLRQRSTVLDFVVILTVVVVAQTIGLIAASGTGIALAIVLFIREQIGGAVVRRKSYGNTMFSKQVRAPEEMAILEERGDACAILELQGSLFFGTTDQFYNAIEPELKSRDYIILDMRRVQSVDITAAHLLEQFQDMLAERGALLIFSELPTYVPSGQNMREYFGEVGLVHEESAVRTFDELDQALEWVEDRIIDRANLEMRKEDALGIDDIGVFSGRRKETIAELESIMETHSYREGDKIFSLGDEGDEIFLIRRGTVRILLPLSADQSIHVSTIGRGSFFGDMAFLDNQKRSADAVAQTDVELYSLSRKDFDDFAEEHRKVAVEFMENVARILAIRLRYANAEVRTLRDPGHE